MPPPPCYFLSPLAVKNQRCEKYRSVFRGQRAGGGKGKGKGVGTRGTVAEVGPGPRGGHKYWTGCLRSSCYGELPRGQFRGSSVNEPPRMPHASFCAPGPLGLCVANSVLNKRTGTWPLLLLLPILVRFENFK